MNDAERMMTTTEEKRESFFAEVLKFALVALIIVVPVRLYIAQPFIVSGASMDPAFGTGHYLIIDEISYRFTPPQRGDVIVLHFPDNPKKFFIKRVIGLPQETLQIHNNAVTIKNSSYPEGFTLQEPYVAEENRGGRNELTLSLSADEYFVLGDNRAASFDSREWGPLEERRIVGRALVRLFPFQKIGLFPGDFETSEKL